MCFVIVHLSFGVFTGRIARDTTGRLIVVK
jgi:hypothetical protein